MPRLYVADIRNPYIIVAGSICTAEDGCATHLLRKICYARAHQRAVLLRVFTVARLRPGAKNFASVSSDTGVVADELVAAVEAVAHPRIIFKGFAAIGRARERDGHFLV